MSIKIAIFGASGRLGRSIINQMADPFLVSSEPDLYIDASLPPGVPKHLQIALASKRPIVIGVTGLSDEVHTLLFNASHSIPIFYSPNFSLGAALLKKFAAFMAQSFYADADIDLIETHHVQKKDAPSGTALSIANTLRTHGKNPTIHSIRSGQTVGIHELILNTAEEQLSLTHTAHSRSAFARGALSAARFLLQQPPGLYGMDDLLESIKLSKKKEKDGRDVRFAHPRTPTGPTET
jgi:4-hydroxy-tetrahydrodipicolinate reductase